MRSLAVAVLALSLGVSAGAATPHVVEGTIAKVVPSKTEIYVKSNTDGKKYEYYFNKSTEIVKRGKPAEFSELKEGQSVRVTAEKKGKRLDPQKVEILE